MSKNFNVGQTVWIVVHGEEYQGNIWSIGSDYATVAIFTTEMKLVEVSLQNLRRWNKD